jgi:hypothetical protein
MNPTKCLSCDKQVSRLQKILLSLATRVAWIVLQRAEETFPAVRESIASVSCLCAQKRILLSYVSCLGQSKYCTVFAVLVRDNRLGHLIIHSFFIPDFTVGIAIALLQPVLTLTALTMALPRQFSDCNWRTVKLSTPFLFEGQLITS